MSIYITLEETELKNFLVLNGIEGNVSYSPISDGVSNSTVLIQNGDKNYVLTIFQKTADEKINFLKQLYNILKVNNFCSPKVLNPGKATQKIQNKPVLLTEFLSGSLLKNPYPEDLKTLGMKIAEMHLITQKLNLNSPNPALEVSCEELLNECVQKKIFNANLIKIIKNDLKNIKQTIPENLPKGIVHGDMVKDNVFFKDHQISGVVGFSQASLAPLVFDLAVVINDWCFDKQAELNIGLVRSLISGYNQNKTLTPQEYKNLPIMCRIASLRTLSKMHTVENPEKYTKIMSFHRNVKNPGEYGIELKSKDK